MFLSITIFVFIIIVFIVRPRYFVLTYFTIGNAMLYGFGAAVIGVCLISLVLVIYLPFEYFLDVQRENTKIIAQYAYCIVSGLFGLAGAVVGFCEGWAQYQDELGYL